MFPVMLVATNMKRHVFWHDVNTVVSSHSVDKVFMLQTKMLLFCFKSLPSADRNHLFLWAREDFHPKDILYFLWAINQPAFTNWEQAESPPCYISHKPQWHYNILKHSVSDHYLKHIFYCNLDSVSNFAAGFSNSHSFSSWISSWCQS